MKNSNQNNRNIIKEEEKKPIIKRKTLKEKENELQIENIRVTFMPPKEAYLYFPPKNEIFELIDDNKNKNKIKINRKLFEGNIELTEFEKEKLENFHDYCKSYDQIDYDYNKLFRNFDYEMCKSVKSKRFSLNSNNINSNFNLFEENYLSKKEIYRFLLANNFDYNKTCPIPNSLGNQQHKQMRVSSMQVRSRVRKCFLRL